MARAPRYWTGHCRPQNDMAGRLYKSHIHNYFVVSTEEGYAWAICECGHERLLAGTMLHGRCHHSDDWVTPSQWNRRLPDNSDRLRGEQGDQA